MSVELFTAIKYIRTKKRKGFLSFISSISMLGLIIGVMALITVLSVMNGFHKELRDRVLNTISHAYITNYENEIKDWKTIQNKIKNPHIIASAPYIQQYGLLTKNNNAKGVSVRGIIPKQEQTVSNILKKMKYGNADIQKNEILIGYGLSRALRVSLGDKITLLTPKITTSILGNSPKFKRFTVAGVFDAGVLEYDNNFAFIHFNTAQKLYKTKGANGIRLKVDDLYNIKNITKQILKNLTTEFYTVTWAQQKRNFFTALQSEKRMIAIILALIIAIAAFNIVSMMIMVITDKKTDIAILRTLGMTPKSIVKIFLYQSLIIGIIGIFIGTILGIALTLNIENIIAIIESIFGFQFFPADVFYISRFPSDLQLSDIIWIDIFSFILVVLASIYPAISAGRTNIAQTLRSL
ncbi:Lipoprotein releasing system transmembrane protein LolE [hydrothermal vent metagenome]|uniref:Lipoprotein releasing system transmembrane protein LolE n=1 Tax=hydrothermal vent metagenome TaxID=652676 RepID=A0A1W1BP52_9ZZZZ